MSTNQEFQKLLYTGSIRWKLPEFPASQLSNVQIFTVEHRSVQWPKVLQVVGHIEASRLSLRQQFLLESSDPQIQRLVQELEQKQWAAVINVEEPRQAIFLFPKNGKLYGFRSILPIKSTLPPTGVPSLTTVLPTGVPSLTTLTITITLPPPVAPTVRYHPGVFRPPHPPRRSSSSSMCQRRQQLLEKAWVEFLQSHQ
jgi:hypothetical protein